MKLNLIQPKVLLILYVFILLTLGCTTEGEMGEIVGEIPLKGGEAVWFPLYVQSIPQGNVYLFYPEGEESWLISRVSNGQIVPLYRFPHGGITGAFYADNKTVVGALYKGGKKMSVVSFSQKEQSWRKRFFQVSCPVFEIQIRKGKNEGPVVVSSFGKLGWIGLEDMEPKWQKIADKAALYSTPGLSKSFSTKFIFHKDGSYHIGDLNDSKDLDVGYDFGIIKDAIVGDCGNLYFLWKGRNISIQGEKYELAVTRLEKGEVFTHGITLPLELKNVRKACFVKRPGKPLGIVYAVQGSAGQALLFSTLEISGNGKQNTHRIYEFKGRNFKPELYSLGDFGINAVAADWNENGLHILYEVGLSHGIEIRYIFWENRATQKGF